MKLATYQPRGAAAQLGVVVGDQVVNLHLASGGELPNDMRSLLSLGESGLQRARKIAGSGDTSHAVALDAVKIKAPISNPSKIVAIGLNYMDHVRETNSPVPTLATMFTKWPSAIIGPGEAIRWDPDETKKVDWEVELGLVIGKKAYRVAVDAYDYIAGYTVCNDVSARDIQVESGDQWVRGKSYDTFCPLGPYLVTKDEVADPNDLKVRCIVNDVVMQDSSTREMIFKIPYLIEYLSRAFTLLPGDVVITGTPHGVGGFRNPPVFLKDGDVVTVEVEGVGTLTNPCATEK